MIIAITANTCAATLAPAATCVITVSFTPTAAGTRAAYVTVTDNANNIAGSTQSAPLTGTGVAVPTAVVAPTTPLTFPTTAVGTTTAAMTATLTNSGTGPLTIASIVIGGTNPGDYAQTNNCGSTLVAGTSCTISVKFDPTANGTRTATITITDNANNVAGSTQTISLTGTGTGGTPAAALSPTVVPFNDTNVGVAATAQTVTLTNSGSSTLTIAGVSLTGANPGDFERTPTTCGSTLAAGANCTISITFKPTAPGNRTATLTITDNANNVTGSTQTAALSGTGVGVPVAGASPSSYGFGLTNVLTTTAAKVVTLKNTGTGPLTITTSSSLIGVNPGDFAVSANTCTSSLAAAANCTISITFTPTASGLRTASLQIVDNSNNVGSTQTVSLTGTGVDQKPAVVSASPTPATGLTNTFTLVYSDPNTAQDLKTVNAIFNVGTGLTNSCYVTYTQATNLVALWSDAGNTLTSLTPGSGTISNDQCTITGSGTSVVTAGNNLTLTLEVTANTNPPGSQNYTGVQSIYMNATDYSAETTGWVKEGVWNPAPNQTPTNVSVTPNPATGTNNTFTLVYSDANGALDLNYVNANFNSTGPVKANTCYVHYVPATNTLQLYNNAGTTLTSITPGSGTLSNSQCTIIGSGTSVARSGNTLTLTLDVTAASTYTGTLDIFMYADDNSSANTGWVNEGTWTP